MWIWCATDWSTLLMQRGGYGQGGGNANMQPGLGIIPTLFGFQQNQGAHTAGFVGLKAIVPGGPCTNDVHLPEHLCLGIILCIKSPRSMWAGW